VQGGTFREEIGVTRNQGQKSTAGIMLAAVLVTSLWAATATLAGDQDMMSTIVDYYRRKQNLPPDINATITNVHDAPIPGTKAATIELSRGTQKQEVGILMSADGRYVVFGEVEDVTTDPFAEIVKKITLKDQPTRGPQDAPVTIVEFSDFQCPYCARAHKTMKDDVSKQFGDKVRWVYKNYPMPFHKWAEPAAIAGECAFEQKEQAFWTLCDDYFEHQGEITPDNFKDKTLEALRDANIDTTAFTACLDEKKTEERVKADVAEGQQVGVTGTPAFLINGRKISGAQPFETFKDLIEDELKRAGKAG
jgi:protein-disulfide isomerase